MEVMLGRIESFVKVKASQSQESTWSGQITSSNHYQHHKIHILGSSEASVTQTDQNETIFLSPLFSSFVEGHLSQNFLLRIEASSRP